MDLFKVGVGPTELPAFGLVLLGTVECEEVSSTCLKTKVSAPCSALPETNGTAFIHKQATSSYSKQVEQPLSSE